ncbi:MAG: UvrD-helicase domain-containing protein [Chitinophagales bacterium]|nr:UvrD-helicase domain-containing protein [Chitinophagales bacterium]
MYYLDELNEIQKSVVTEIEGPVLINAGPGSGKTRVLTYRIAFMLEQGIEPYHILALTFTNKAAKEMKKRIESLIGSKAQYLFMGTFHAVFSRILRNKAELLGYTNNFTIYDTEDSRTLIKQIIKDFNLDDSVYKPKSVQSRISNLKNNLINYKLYASNLDIQMQDNERYLFKMGDIYKEYVRRCFKNNAMDFDDLLLKTYELLVRFPEVLYELQHKFKYLMIDEFQDTNLSQYEIIKKLGDIFQNICVVGDDSQSIYGFRGASIDNILNFKKDYPTAKIFLLEQNYRSTKNIVEIANKVIKHNTKQLDKTIWTKNDDGMKMPILKAVSDNDEGIKVVNHIIELKHRYQVHNHEIVILCRTNSQSRAFEEALRRSDIPYRVYAGLSFFQRKEIKDAIAYLKLLINPHDDETLKRIINYPTRGIGNTSMTKVMLYAQQNNKSIYDTLPEVAEIGITGKAKEALMNFHELIALHRLRINENAYQVAENLLKTSGLYHELDSDKSVEGISRYENLVELLNSIKEHTERDEHIEGISLDEYRSLGYYLQSVTLLTDQDKEKEGEDTVKIMTIHASKGLEFKAVYLVGMENNLFPSIRATYDEDDLEEERRLFYVAVTRAEAYLTFSFATQRYKMGKLENQMPSSFLREVPEIVLENPQILKTQETLYSPRRDEDYSNTPNVLRNLKQNIAAKTNSPRIDVSNFIPDPFDSFEEGDNIEHIKFGKGHIDSLEGEGDKILARITFESEGLKTIVLKFAKMRKAK